MWTPQDTIRGRIGSARIQEIVMVKQKLRNKQNDVRDDIGETRVVIEVVATSLAAEQIKVSRIRVHIVLTRVSYPLSTSCYNRTP